MSTVQISDVRVVVFDLDDTLYPERSFAFSGFDAVAHWLQERMDCPMDPAARMRELFDTHDRSHVFDTLLAELGCDRPKQMVKDMICVYRTHKPLIKLYDDADRILSRLAGRFHLAVISDGPANVQQNKIDALGLQQRIDRIVLTDIWGPTFWKPHPRAYLEIERIWDYRDSSCLYIADNAEKDFKAPLKLGWQTIQIRRPDGVYAHTIATTGSEPHQVITTLDQVNLTSR
ncbi:MAG: HAD family hydrolase [Planctomycetota bacterium]|nr:MAG: HAD family hydrolase [Planctomycetota bacterium]